MSVSGDQPYVFISYASADRERVLEVVAVLREAGITCWLDQDGIEGGANWGQRITEAIAACSALILMSSAASLTSRNVRQEVAVAWKFDRPYLPLLLDLTPVPKALTYWLETAQWIDVLDHPELVWLPQVLQSLRRLFESPHSPASTTLPAADVPRFTLTSLPSPSSSLIGRDREVMEVAGLLQAERIVTLTGPGGIGKTRVGLAVGHRMAAAYRDGVVFVDLAPVTDPSAVLSAIATRLNVREAAGRPIRDQLALAMRAQQLLLILDNLEQVIDAATDLGWLVTQCPSLAILCTSRESLRISSEMEYPIAPLPVPDQSRVWEIETLRENPTMVLFVERAQASKPGFELTTENAESIVAICSRLDGLPLAIELAAARVRALSPRALLERLGDPLRFLAGGARDLPDRQRTIRDAIQWSYDLLSPDEQRLLCHVGVFASGWTLDAAETVINGVDGALALDVLDGLISLADKSLITRRDQDDGDTRYDMLTTIREFAREHLSQRGELETSQRAHAEYFVQRLEAIDASVDGAGSPDGVRYADHEYANLRAAIQWGLEHDAHLAALLVATLVRFWLVTGRLREGFTLTTAALSVDPRPTATRCQLLQAAVDIAVNAGDTAIAIGLAAEAVALARTLADPSLLGQTLMPAGLAYFYGGDMEQAEAMWTEALPLTRTHGDRITRGDILTGLSLVAMRRSDHDAALSFIEDAVALSRRAPTQMAGASELVTLGDVLTRRGEHQQALAAFHELLMQPAALADIRWTICAIEGIAAISAARSPAHAAQLFGAARAMRDRAAFGLELAGLDVSGHVAQLTNALPPGTFTAAWERGQQLSLDEATAFALGQIGH